MQHIKIKSKKGFLAAVVHQPKEKTDKLAVLCPGLLDSKDYSHLVALAEMLSGMGYTAVRFDPTGTWESSGDISDYDTTQYLEDVKTVIDYMAEKGEYKNILIGGHSRGGRMSILSAARDPRITLALGIMPSSGNAERPKREKWEREGIKISQRDLPENKNEKREYRLPFSHLLNLEKYDTLAEAAKIKVPVVLISGELDEVIFPEDVKELYNSVQSQKKFVIVPKIGHNYRYNAKEIEIVNNIIKEQLESVGG